MILILLLLLQVLRPYCHYCFTITIAILITIHTTSRTSIPDYSGTTVGCHLPFRAPVTTRMLEVGRLGKYSSALSKN